MARQIASRKGFHIVGAIDIDSKKIGQDVGVIIGATRKLRVKVGVDIGKTIKASKPDVAVLCTSSSLKGVLPELLEVIKHRVPVVTTTEEAAYPRKQIATWPNGSTKPRGRPGSPCSALV